MKTLWQSIDGSIRSFSAMTDEHLANVLLHMTHYKFAYSLEAFQEALHEACNVRDLSNMFLHSAPYPYKDLRTKKWMIWSFEEHTVVEVRKLAGR
jgi:hypothetical protein